MACKSSAVHIKCLACPFPSSSNHLLLVSLLFSSGIPAVVPSFIYLQFLPHSRMCLRRRRERIFTLHNLINHYDSEKRRRKRKREREGEGEGYVTDRLLSGKDMRKWGKGKWGKEKEWNGGGCRETKREMKGWKKEWNKGKEKNLSCHKYTLFFSPLYKCRTCRTVVVGYLLFLALWFRG